MKRKKRAPLIITLLVDGLEMVATTGKMAKLNTQLAGGRITHLYSIGGKEIVLTFRCDL